MEIILFFSSFFWPFISQYQYENHDTAFVSIYFLIEKIMRIHIVDIKIGNIAMNYVELC